MDYEVIKKLFREANANRICITTINGDPHPEKTRRWMSAVGMKIKITKMETTSATAFAVVVSSSAISGDVFVSHAQCSQPRRR